MLNTTLGQLLVNETLPEELRDYNRTLDKKGMHTLLEQVAREHPEKYREVSFKLNQIGQRASQDQGGMSFGARHLRRSKAANATRERIQAQLAPVFEDDSLDDQQRADKIVEIVGKESGPQQKAILEEAIKDKNPLAMQVLSGSRGKPMNLASLLGSDMLYSDHRDEVIPIPVLRSYSEGLTPEEYWAGTYGARRGIIATKFATQDAGFLSKQLNQAGHRLVVMDEDGDGDLDPQAPARGMIVDTDDMDNEGSLLARDMGPYKRNTPLTPKILKHLKRLGKGRILIRSPLVGGSPEGGVYARDVGVRETGKLPGRGEQVGLQAAQALSEPISQGQLSAKHSGGVAGQEKAVGGFEYINQLIQVPKKMRGGASHATVDGKVQRVEEAPAGGHYVTVNDEKHYVGEGFNVKVKKGDEIEAGDMLSDGIPNPALITQYKGVGEGRRYFVNEFRKAMAGSGMQGHRRNIELLARGLINHVKLTEETDEHAPDDIVPYSTLEHTYKPREDHQRLSPKKALGQYLERPVLHYSIGTKIRPSMLKDFEEFEVGEIPVHKNPPPFEPHMVRGMYQLQHDPDWMTQMYGSGLKKSLLNSTARGATSEDRGTSFVPSLATGTDFGEVPNRAVIQPKAPYELPKVDLPKPEKPGITPAGNPGTTSFFGGRFKLGMAKQAAESAIPKPKAPTTPNHNAQQLQLPNSNAPSVPTAPPAPRDVTPNNIMPSGAPSAADLIPKQMGGNVTMPEGWQPASLSPEQIQQYGTNADAVNARGYRMIGLEPPQPMSLPQDATSSSPPPATPAQAAVDQKQVAKQAPSSALNNPAVGQHVANVARQGGGEAAVMSLGSFADPQAMMRLFGGGQAKNRLASTRMQKGEAARTLSVEELARQSARQRAAPPQPQQAAPQPTTPDLVSPTAGKGNQFDPTSGNALARYTVAAGVGKGLQTVANKVAPVAIKQTATRAPLLTRLAIGAKNMVLPGANLAKSTAVGGGGAAGGFAALPALGGLVAVNAITEGIDAAGALPQWAGGTGMGNFGWDQESFDRDTTQNSYLSASGKSIMNPLKSLKAINDGGNELKDWGTSKVVDLATGTDEADRAHAQQKVEGEAFQKSKQEQLGQQKQKLRSQIEGDSQLGPDQKKKLMDQYLELDAQIKDSIAKTKNLTDETANWNTGNQDWFGDQGHKFRDAMTGTRDALDQRVSDLQAKANAGQLSEDELASFENDKHRRDSINRNLSLYEREVGWSGEGDFDNMVRTQVRTAKDQLVEYGRRMREPAVQNDPKLLAQLKRDYLMTQERIHNYRTWGNASK